MVKNKVWLVCEFFAFFYFEHFGKLFVCAPSYHCIRTRALDNINIKKQKNKTNSLLFLSLTPSLFVHMLPEDHKISFMSCARFVRFSDKVVMLQRQIVGMHGEPREREKVSLVITISQLCSRENSYCMGNGGRQIVNTPT